MLPMEIDSHNMGDITISSQCLLSKKYYPVCVLFKYLKVIEYSLHGEYQVYRWSILHCDIHRTLYRCTDAIAYSVHVMFTCEFNTITHLYILSIIVFKVQFMTSLFIGKSCTVIHKALFFMWRSSKMYMCNKANCLFKEILSCYWIFLCHVQSDSPFVAYSSVLSPSELVRGRQHGRQP